MRHKIYLITNSTNSKGYVGYTSKCLEWRLNQHKDQAVRNPKSLLHREMIRLGVDNFHIQLLISGNDKTHILNEQEQHFIDKYNTIEAGYNQRKGGGGIHITRGIQKKVDVYDKSGQFIKTFPSRVALAEHIGCHPAAISAAISNADKGKGSQVHGMWVCHHGETPVYKKPNTIPGTLAAKKKNSGKTRPSHSAFMKEYNAVNADSTRYLFEHKDGRTFTGTRYEFINRHSNEKLSNSEIGVTIRGGYKTHRGWCIKPI